MQWNANVIRLGCGALVLGATLAISIVTAQVQGRPRPSQSSPPGDYDQSARAIEARLISRDGILDTRRPLRGIEVAQASSVGYFHRSGQRSTFNASGFAVRERDLILTAAHAFAAKDVWHRQYRSLDGSFSPTRVEFYSATCKQSYPIKSLKVRVKDGGLREFDYGVVRLARELCPTAVPLRLVPSDASDIAKMQGLGSQYVSVPAYQLITRDTSAFSLLISYGAIVGYATGFNRKVLNTTVSTLPGASGGPLLAYTGPKADVPIAIGINVAESTGENEPFNRAVVIDHEFLEWFKSAVDTLRAD